MIGFLGDLPRSHDYRTVGRISCTCTCPSTHRRDRTGAGVPLEVERQQNDSPVRMGTGSRRPSSRKSAFFTENYRLSPPILLSRSAGQFPVRDVLNPQLCHQPGQGQYRPPCSLTSARGGSAPDFDPAMPCDTITSSSSRCFFALRAISAGSKGFEPACA